MGFFKTPYNTSEAIKTVSKNPFAKTKSCVARKRYRYMTSTCLPDVRPQKKKPGAKTTIYYFTVSDAFRYWSPIQNSFAPIYLPSISDPSGWTEWHSDRSKKASKILQNRISTLSGVHRTRNDASSEIPIRQGLTVLCAPRRSSAWRRIALGPSASCALEALLGWGRQGRRRWLGDQFEAGVTYIPHSSVGIDACSLKTWIRWLAFMLRFFTKNIWFRTFICEFDLLYL